MYYRTRTNNPLVGFIVLLLVGAGFLCAGIFVLKENAAMAANGTEADGIVVDVKREISGKSVSYWPVIEFVTANGEEITSIPNQGGNFERGQKVNILYKKEDPGYIMINSFFNIYGFPLIFIVIGSVVLILWLGMIINAIKSRRRRNEFPEA